MNMEKLRSLERLKNLEQLKSIQKLKLALRKTAEDQYPIANFGRKIIATIIGWYFVVILFIFKNSSFLQRNILFLHFVQWPMFVDYNKPEDFDLKGVKNFYLSTKDGVKLGVWQILPASYINDTVNPETFNNAFNDGKPIIVYVHGNSGSRASNHRIQLYKILQENQCHVVAFDYRCFGDSSYTKPDEVGLVEDTTTVLKWVLDKKPESPVYIWGHSLGAAVGARAAAELEKKELPITGIILESPFNNLEDCIRNHFLSSFLKHMIGFDYFIVKPFKENGLTFTTDMHLVNSNLPVFIVHSSDDWVIPSRLGKKLYDYLLNKRSNPDTVKFLEFGSGGYGHKYICKSPILIKLINLFLAGKLEEIPPYVA